MGVEVIKTYGQGVVLAYRVSWRRVPLLSSLHGEKESQNSIKSVPFQTHFHLDIEILRTVCHFLASRSRLFLSRLSLYAYNSSRLGPFIYHPFFGSRLRLRIEIE